MTTITIPQEKLDKVLTDVEILIEDVSSLFNQDKRVKQRLAEIKSNPPIGKSEAELDLYLKKRGVKID